MQATQNQPLPETQTAPKRVTILGATGSIGDSTLRVIAQHGGRYQVAALTAQDNAEKLIALATQWRPAMVAIGNEAHFHAVRDALKPLGIRVEAGEAGIEEAAAEPTDTTLAAIVGAAGLKPVMRAIEQGADVGLANKEALVCAGDIVMRAVTKHGATLLPVDSEHNAIFQLMHREAHATIEKITLTASGGPFLHRPLETMKDVTPQEAVKHPRWSMGAKISVDSATMMNKGLELIEAHYLFAMPPEQLDAIIHPESIVHSFVHCTDGSVLAQMAMPDMAIPIAYALGWPQRIATDTARLDLAKVGKLHFEAVELARFPAYALALEALRAGPAQRIALNAANEVAVGQFLAGEIAYTGIAETVARVMAKTNNSPITSLDDVLAADAAARQLAQIS
ncbi:MAG: 1-deoxy-D-xylulose-5-phosphate reductoisomerase [Rickettsiales bacterium]